MPFPEWAFKDPSYKLGVLPKPCDISDHTGVKGSAGRAYHSPLPSFALLLSPLDTKRSN